MNFIQNELPNLLLAQPQLSGQTLVKCSTESKSHLDGFMSSIFTMQLTLKDSEGCE